MIGEAPPLDVEDLHVVDQTIPSASVDADARERAWRLEARSRGRWIRSNPPIKVRECIEGGESRRAR